MLVSKWCPLNLFFFKLETNKNHSKQDPASRLGDEHSPCEIFEESLDHLYNMRASVVMKKNDLPAQLLCV